jgi:hypothetical protein
MTERKPDGMLVVTMDSTQCNQYIKKKVKIIQVLFMAFGLNRNEFISLGLCGRFVDLQFAFINTDTYFGLLKRSYVHIHLPFS